MAYKVMVEIIIKGFPGDSMKVEWSGIVHDLPEDARKEMATIGREARERGNIGSVWVEEVEE